jgi:hypothetical protein
MTSYRLILGAGLLSVAFSFGALDLRGQETPQNPDVQKPKPAGTSYPIPTIDPNSQQDQENSTNGLQPDNTPLTGIQTPTLGSPEIVHSFWEPGIQYAGSIQSNSSGQSGSSNWSVDNFIIGNLSLLKAWNRSQLAFNYSGGGVFSTSSSQGSGTYQQLALTQTFQWNRWGVQILDQFSYLPQSSFGFGGGTNLGIPGVGGSIGPTIPGMGIGYVPSQSIYAALGPRYSNATALQVTFATSPRGSVTMTGSYGILNFVDPGNVNNDTTTGTVGYNYALTRENSIGGFYRFSSYHYPGQPQAFGDNSFNIAFSRKLTGRMALQFYGGPDITTFRIPVGGQSSKIGANVGLTLSYALVNGGLFASYFHGLTGGSGVFTGSTVDQVNFGANHKLSRVWSGQGNFGFAHNSAVVSSTASSFPTYNSWYVGGGVSRPIGQNFNIAIAYNANINAYSQSGCTGGSCGGNQVYNYITINFQWHTRHFVLP